MFQFPGFPSHDYVFIIRYLDITLSEFPHSEILGSQFTCNSPKLIAAYHVLHRLLVPRHSPCTLNNLTSYQSLIFFKKLSLLYINVISLNVMQFSKYKHGGDEEDRTPDPLRARQVLSQLSYTPIFIFTTIYIL